MLNNEYPILYRQWKDYFDFLEVSLVLPEVAFGQVGLSTRLKNDAFSNGDKTSFLLNIRTSIGSESSLNAREVHVIIFGFGLKAIRVTGY